MKQFYLSFLLSLIFSWCTKKRSKLINFPKLTLSSHDTIIVLNSDKMLASTPSLYGINILDSLDFSKKVKYNTLNFSEDYYNQNIKNYDSLLIFVDTSNVDFHTDEMSFYSYLPPPPPPSDSSYKDSIYFDKIYNEYIKFLNRRSKEHFKTFPLFIYNSKSSNIVVQKPIDGELFFIVEAKDELGFWKPIEYWEQKTFLCGTGHEDYSLKSKHFIVSAVKRYQGDFKTKLRVRFTSFNKVFFSNEYSGYINKSQFDSIHVIDDIERKFKHRDTSQIDERINRSFLNPIY